MACSLSQKPSVLLRLFHPFWAQNTHFYPSRDLLEPLNKACTVKNSVLYRLYTPDTHLYGLYKACTLLYQYPICLCRPIWSYKALYGPYMVCTRLYGALHGHMAYVVYPPWGFHQGSLEGPLGPLWRPPIPEVL